MPENTDRTKGSSFIPYPGFFARFYDLIYHQVRDTVDSSYYLETIMGTKGSILEVGSGTGRLLIEALEKGADIYGIDISPAMLEILTARISPEHRKRISLQNITDFRIDKEFDLIVAPFRVFMHLTEKEDQLNALNNVCNHLKPGGRFIFDVFVPDLKPLITGLSNVVDFDGEYEPGNRVKRIVSTEPDLINQVINLTFRLEWNEGINNFKGEWKSSLRYFFRFELEHLIERSQFRNYRIFGDFDGNGLTNESKEFIAECIK